MATEPDDQRRDDARDDVARRAAQDSAAELARMGIDPRALGLEPPAPPAREVAAPGPAQGTVYGSPRGTTHRPDPAGDALPADPTSLAPPPPWPSPLQELPVPAPPPSWTESTLNRPIGGVSRAPSPAAAEVAEPLERIVATPAPPPPGAWRRAVRAATLGVIEPGAAAAVEYERQLVARARLRRAEPRMVAFLAGKGGVGTTTTAAGVALTLATLRTDTTALISARTGAGSLGQRLLGRPAPPVPAVAGDEPEQEPLWVYGSLAVVDGPPWHTPTVRSSLVKLMERLRGQHPFTVVDIGNDLGESADAALGRADQVVLVTGTGRDSIAATRVALSRIHQVDPFRLATVVVAVTCASTRQYRQAARRLHAELGLHGPRIVPIGFDPWLAAGDQIDPARMRATTRTAYLRIAGLVVEPGRPHQWFSQPTTARAAAAGAAPPGLPGPGS